MFKKLFKINLLQIGIITKTAVITEITDLEVNKWGGLSSPVLTG